MCPLPDRASSTTGAVSPISIAPYDPSWPAAFQAESLRIREALGEIALRVDHVGSTSIPGLGAKPVIDIQISVRELHPLDPYRDRLATLGYRHAAHSDDAFYPFFHRPHDWPHTHHIHVCAAGGEQERRQLAFRDYLRDHPDTAEAYEAEKLALAAQHISTTMETRNAYADAKSGFIEPLVKRAMAEGYPKASPENHG